MAIDDNTLYGLTGAQVKEMVQRRGNTEISQEPSKYGNEGEALSLDSNGTIGHLRVGVDIMNDGSEGFLYLNDSYPGIRFPSTDVMYQAITDALPVNVSELYNDAGYQSASQVSSAIASAISGITSFSYEIVQTLPASGKTGTIYLIANTGTTPNIYDEYLWVNGNWEKIGTTEADLSQYYTKTEVDTALGAKANSADVYTKTQADTLLNAKQNTLTAGSNVQIVNDTISATDTTYTAGTGLSLTGTQFSIDNTVALKSEIPTITMTNVDPGEGSALAANNFIGVYE